MSSVFSNVYDDAGRAASYATLEFPGTYFLAYRDLPELIRKHVTGAKALDFGCGAGRSTRFLRRLGLDAIGIDISEQMIAQAGELDPVGDYRLARGDDMAGLEPATFDLVQAIFTFDNVPVASKPRLLEALRRLLKPTGRMLILVSRPEIYVHEWTSFTTKEFTSNQTAKSGDVVYTVMLDVEDRRPVEDVLCTHEDYLRLFEDAGLAVVDTHLPLGREDEPFAWVNETMVPPWIIYVLARLEG